MPIPVVSALCPWIIVASICIFTGFSLLDIRHDYSRLASSTFFIYLIHAGIWDVLSRIIRKIFGAEGDSRVLIPMSIICVFMISLELHAGWKALYKEIKEEKIEHSNRIAFLGEFVSWISIIQLKNIHRS